ncbi:MAG: prolipoprotein diacylglyceryl transferase, partial [Cyanobacteria bacterium REEB65]|nr:prolipoprotein diacylglyceryl transferase [Cyanobacteria bacterium REEB65]
VDHFYNIALYGTLLGITCARIFYVAHEWKDFYSSDPLEALAVWHGGLAIHGAVIGAVTACSIYCWRHKLDVVKYFDLSAPCLLIGQVVGRWGNFFNHEAYGAPAVAPPWFPFKNAGGYLPWGLHIDPAHRMHGSPSNPIPPYDDLSRYPASGPHETLFHPTFLYESLWDLTGLAIILWIMRTRPVQKGNVLMMYLVVWGSGRTWVEGLRTDPLRWVIAGHYIREAQVLSALLCTAGLTVLALRAWKAKQRLADSLVSTSPPPTEALR